MLSIKARNITPAATIELSAIIAELKQQKQNIIKLNIGEPDFATPENVANAAKEAIDEHFTKYVAVPGIPELRKAICKKLEQDNHINYDYNEICVSAGAKQSVLNSMFVLCDEGDEVIIPTPCWVSYSEIVKLAGAIPVFVECRSETGFALDLEAIEKAVTNKTKAIIICTPNNPTGSVYSESSLRTLAEIAIKHDFYIVSDEIYEKLLYDEAIHFSIASISKEVRDRCITINGFSKAYAMPGWRLGYSAANMPIASSIKAIQGHMTSSANTIAQKAGVEALNGPQDALGVMRAEYERRRDYAYKTLKAIPGFKLEKPQGAFYLFPEVSAYFGTHYCKWQIKDAKDLANYLLKEAHVATVFGEAFNMSGHIRISYSNSMENIHEALEKMKEALLKLKKY